MGGTPLDRISIRDIKTSGRHGVSDEERREYQEFLVDIDIDTDATAAIESDDVSKTVDYSEVVEEASRMVAEESFNLVETLASGIANRILEMEHVERVEVTVRKTGAPLVADVSSVGVTIVRGKGL